MRRRAVCTVKAGRSADKSSEGLAEFGHLRRGHRQAIALAGVARKEVLMVTLGRMVVGERAHLGHDGAGIHTLTREFIDECLGLSLLLGRGEVDAAAVLRAHVVALPVQCGGVMDEEEDFQQLARADLRRIVDQLDHLVVTGGAGAHLLVGGRRGVAIAVAGLDIEYTAHFHIDGFGAPKATTSKNDGLKVFSLL